MPAEPLAYTWCRQSQWHTLPLDSPFPIPDFWAAISRGEVLVGEYRYPAGEGAKALLLVNHNAYQPQTVEFTLASDVVGQPLRFDRAASRWVELDRAEDAWRLSIPPAGLKLVRVQ